MASQQTKTGKKRITKSQIKSTLLVEAAWEVLNQVGGIYTVVRSKVPTMKSKWGDNYCLLGPYMPQHVAAEFEEVHDLKDDFGKAVKKMQEMGLGVHYGVWLVSGRPKVVLFDLVYDAKTGGNKISFMGASWY